MITVRLQAPTQPEPFADDTAGLGYFTSDFHYEHLVARLSVHLAATRGFVLVSGEPPPDGELVERALNARNDTVQRATLVRCRTGMTFDAVARAYARQLGLKDEAGGGGQWALLSRLMADSREGMVRVLVLENADALDDRSFDGLHGFATLDDPHFLPVVLLTQPSFAARLDAPSLQFLQPAIVAHLPLQHLEPEEVAAFIRYQLNATDGGHQALFTRDAIAAIADAAKGDPAAVNRLARQAAGIVGHSQVPARPPAPDSAPAVMLTPAPAVKLKAEPEARIAANVIAAVRPPHPKRAVAPNIAHASAPVVAAPAESAVPMAPRSTRSSARTRTILPAAAIAGYLLLAGASAAALLYLLATDAEREAETLAAETPQVQTMIADDIPTLAPPPAPHLAKPKIEAPPPVPPPAESIAAAALPAVPDKPAADAEPPPQPPQPAVAAAEPPAAEPPASAAPPGERAADALAAIEPAAGGNPPAAAVATIEPEAAQPAVPAAEPPAAEPPASAAPAPDERAADAPAAIEPAASGEPPAEAVAAVEAEAAQLAVAAQVADTPPTAAAAAAAPPVDPEPAPAERVASPPAAPAPTAGAKPPAEAVAKLEPEAARTPPPATDKPPRGATAPLVRRGEQLLAFGDIVSARHFFERAAEAGDAAAACGLGKSYDPLFLRRVGTRGVVADPAKAVDWYRRAVRGGSNEAAARLAQLLVKFPQ